MEIWQKQSLDTTDAESGSEQVVKEPVLSSEIEDSGWDSNKTCDKFAFFNVEFDLFGEEGNIEVNGLFNDKLGFPVGENFFKVIRDKLEQAEESKEGEMDGEDFVEDVFIEIFEDDVESKKHARSVDREKIGVFAGHTLKFALFFLVESMVEDSTSIAADIYTSNAVNEELDSDWDGHNEVCEVNDSSRCIAEGQDEGVLLMGHEKGSFSFWKK